MVRAARAEGMKAETASRVAVRKAERTRYVVFRGVVMISQDPPRGGGTGAFSFSGLSRRLPGRLLL